MRFRPALVFANLERPVSSGANHVDAMGVARWSYLVNSLSLFATPRHRNFRLAKPSWLFAFALASLTAASGQPVSVEQFRPHDLVLRAPAPENPYTVALSAEIRGPNGVMLRIPGFYHGDDAWVIRFSAPSPGKWRLRTTSSLPALSGHEREFSARPAPAASRVHGVLQVDPASPRHFRFEDGTRFFPMGYEADWLWGADMLDPERKLMRRTIEQMDENGFNYVLVNVYAHDTKWNPGKSSAWDFAPTPLYAFGGSNEAPDHTRLNEKFFLAYDEMMWALWERGIVAHVMIKVYNKLVNWPAPGSPEEARYFQYVVARYQAFPNVVWDFSKEAKNEKNDELQHNLIALIRAEDAYGHLVTVHDDDSFMWNPRLAPTLDFQTIQRHANYQDMVRFSRGLHPGPVLNSEFGYEFGVEPLPTHRHRDQVEWPVLLERAYIVTFAGSHPVYYYNNTAWDVVKPDPEPPGIRRWKLFKEIIDSLPYSQMEPREALAFGAHCMARPGDVYAFYSTGPDFLADLRDLPRRGKGTWINTWTGEQQAALVVEPAVQSFRKPAAFAEAPAVLIVRAE